MAETLLARIAGNGYGRFVVRHRWLVIAATVVAVALAAAGAPRLSVNPDSRVFFGKNNPQLKALEQFENTYTKTDNVFFVLAPRSGTVFRREVLDAVAWLTEASWRTPYSRRVDSITNYQHTRARGDELLVEDAWRGDVAATRAAVMDAPELVDRLISRDATVTGVNVTVVTPGTKLQEVPEIARFARARAADFRERYPDIDLYLVGGVMIDMAFNEVPEQDTKTLFPIMVAAIFLIIGLALRSVVWSLLMLATVIVTVITTLGLAGWAGVVLNAGTMGAPIIIVTLAVAHGVHIAVSARHELRAGTGKHDALVESLRVNMSPVFITSATTAIGFLSMNFSDAPPFRLLGNLVAGGVMVAFALSVTFLPAAMAVLPSPRLGVGELGAGGMARFAEFVIARRRVLLWSTGVLILALGLGITRISLDDDFIEYFDQRFDIRTHSDFAEDHLTGLNALEYSVPDAREGGIADPAYLAKLDAFTQWLEAQPKVTHVDSIVETFKRLNRNMHGDDPAYHRLPDSAELAAQYLLLYELSLPFGLDLNDRINVAKSASRVTALVTDITSKEMRTLDARAQAWLADNAPGMAAPGTGLSLMFAHISERNINAMLTGSIIALVLISAVLILALGSLRIGLISLMPNLFPAGIAFGLWGYVSGEVGLAIAVVVAMTLGIVVDDTVHFLSKYLRARRELGMDATEGVRYAFRTVGTALWITSLCLVCGFLVLAFSGFKVNAEMGLLSALTIAVALAADYLFLPPLLMRLEAKT
jgi:predicted RND superfamily exporter protein